MFNTNKGSQWIQWIAIGLLLSGLLLLVAGLIIAPPKTFKEFVTIHHPEWLGLFANGLLLLLFIFIIKKQEKERLLNQLGSTSNAFALDAARQIKRKGWLNDGSTTGRDFSQSNLKGVDLRESNLQECNFSNANLREAKLFGAKLQNANLMAANLKEAELRNAQFNGANLRWANLENAILAGADLRGADLRWANLKGARMQSAITEGALTGGPLSEEEVKLVQGSFQYLLNDFDDFTNWFYFRLFHLDPSIKKLFIGNMRPQKQKFMQTLELLVSSLDEAEKIIPVIQALGRRHNDYGVIDQHYQLVADSLVWALEKKLSYSFTEDLKNAWLKTYDMIAMVMKDASQ